MLALHAGRFPLVNPAAFVYQGDSIWITTSRFAAKFALARRDPRASFLVTGSGRSVELQGLLEPYDLRSVAGMLRAAADGPRFGLAMAGYTLKNAGYIGGYLVDLAGIPREWWPWNRVVIRLRVDRYRALVAEAPPRAARSSLDGVPASVGRSLETQGTGYLCWDRKGYPSLAPALWVAGGAWEEAGDRLAAEEPLQLSLGGSPLSIVMRTPGHDLELALGLLWAEGVITSLEEVARVRVSAEAQESEPALEVAGDLLESNQVDFSLHGAPARL